MSKEISTRKSIRSFIKDKPIPTEIKDKILLAGMSAPSGVGRHPVRYMILEDKDILNKLKEIPGKTPLETSTLNILVLVDMDAPIANEVWVGLWPQDCAASMTCMLLEAHFNGLGGTWGGLYPNEDFVEIAKEALNLPDNLIPFGIAIMGYPDEVETEKSIEINPDWIL